MFVILNGATACVLGVPVILNTVKDIFFNEPNGGIVIQSRTTACALRVLVILSGAKNLLSNKPNATVLSVIAIARFFGFASG